MSTLPKMCKECGQLLITAEQRKYGAGLRKMLREARVEIKQRDKYIGLLLEALDRIVLGCCQDECFALNYSQIEKIAREAICAPMSGKQ